MSSLDVGGAVTCHLSGLSGRPSPHGTAAGFCCALGNRVDPRGLKKIPHTRCPDGTGSLKNRSKRLETDCNGGHEDFRTTVVFLTRIRLSGMENDITSLAFLMPSLLFMKMLSNFVLVYIFAVV